MFSKYLSQSPQHFFRGKLIKCLCVTTRTVIAMNIDELFLAQGEQPSF